MLWMKIINDASGSIEFGNYEWTIGVNERVLASGQVLSHRRSTGAESLLREVLRKASPQLEQAFDGLQRQKRKDITLWE